MESSVGVSTVKRLYVKKEVYRCNDYHGLLSLFYIERRMRFSYES